MQNRCNAQRKRLKLEAGLTGGVLAARQVGGGRQAPAFRECDPCFDRRRSTCATEEHSQESPYRRTKGGPQAKNAFGGDRLPEGSMPGKVFGNSHAVLQAVMD
jgi:hypothetical protein